MSDLQIVNRALRLIGNAPAASMVDTARGPSRAIAAYEYCRDEILRMIPWPSCVTRVRLNNMAEQACPWSDEWAYRVGDRVTTAGPPMRTYVCTTAGISAALPAAGPAGTGSGIADGTVVWAYVEATTVLNNWSHWPLTDYAVGDLVTADNFRVYVCVTAGTTAAAAPPAGTAMGQADGTVVWDYYGTPPYNITRYTYQYVMPADCLRILKIPDTYALEEKALGVQYLREGNWLYCDQNDSWLRYIRQEENPSLWDPLLRATVALRIATEIVFDITGQAQLTGKLYQEFALIFGTAKTAALNEGAEGPPEQARWEEVG